MEQLVFSGPAGITILVAYAAIMLAIGYYAGRNQKAMHESMSGYYLAGKNLGIIALFFTLYATQYSGNTVIGYAPTAYRLGFSWLQSVTFMTMIIAVYLLYAPRLYVLSKQKGFVTPADWLQHRFQSKAVTLLGVFLMLWGLGNYLLEQLVAIGQGIAGLTGGTIPYQLAVIGFVVVMLVYKWMGGMRAVAFTDVMQGVALFVGIVVLLIGALMLVDGNIAEVSRYIAVHEPTKIGVPSLEQSLNWFSLMLLVGIGAAMYPQAIQRIYAAKSERTLKRSFAQMAWMPPLTTGLVFIVGIIGIMVFPGLDKASSEQLVGMMANQVAGLNGFFYWMMVLLFGGVIAAIVSTADSVLLSLSSMISNDVYGRFVNPGAPEKKKILIGKVWGVLIVTGLLFIAWYPPGTLYEIFVLKVELLIQVAPAFLLGLYWQRLSAGPVFWGMFAGAALAGMLTLTGHKTIFGIHGGMWGFLLNLTICVVGSLFIPASQEQRARIRDLTAMNLEG